MGLSRRYLWIAPFLVLGQAIAQPIPQMQFRDYQAADISPLFAAAANQSSVQEWDYIVQQGLAAYAATWEQDAVAQMEASITAENRTDAFHSEIEYRDFLRSALLIQKEDTWQRIEQNIMDYLFSERELFLQGNPAADSLDSTIQPVNFSALEGSQSTDPAVAAAQKQLYNDRRAWEKSVQEQKEKGLSDFNAVLGALDQQFYSFVSELNNADARYQNNLARMEQFELEVRTGIGQSVDGLEQFMGSSAYFQTCDQNGCALNAQGVELQTLIASLRTSLNNNVPLSAITLQMAEYLERQQADAQATRDQWHNLAHEQVSRNYDEAGAGQASLWQNMDIDRIITYYSHAPGNRLAYLQSQYPGRQIESVGNIDVCGFNPSGFYQPFPLTIPGTVAGTGECASSVGSFAVFYSGCGLGGWAGVPIILCPNDLAEPMLRISLNYVVYDANADANEQIWAGYLNDLTSAASHWRNELLPAISTWEDQVAAYRAEYQGWQADAQNKIIDAQASYRAAADQAMLERNMWLVDFEEAERAGRAQWSERQAKMLGIIDRIETEAARKKAAGEDTGDTAALLAAELAKLDVPEPAGISVKPAISNTLGDMLSNLPELTAGFLNKSEENLPDTTALEKLQKAFEQGTRVIANLAVAQKLSSDAIETQKESQAEIVRMAEAQARTLLTAANYSKVYQAQFSLLSAADQAKLDLGEGDPARKEVEERLEKATVAELERMNLKDPGFRVIKTADGGVRILRQTMTGGAVFSGVGDPRDPNTYNPAFGEYETIDLIGGHTAAVRLAATGSLNSDWDLEKIGKETRENVQSYQDEMGKLLETISGRVESANNVQMERIKRFQQDAKGQAEIATLIIDLAQTLLTGGTWQSWVQGQVRGKIAGELARMSGLPQSFISALLGGKNITQATQSMLEDFAWQNLGNAIGNQELASLLRGELGKSQQRKAEREARRIGPADLVANIATLGAAYAVKTAPYNKGLEKVVNATSLVPGVGTMFSMIRSTYTQGGLGNALKSGLNSVKATFQATKEVLTGEGISMRTAQAMTGLSENYLSELPGFVKPRRDTHAGNRLAAYTGVDNAVTQVRSVEAALKAQYKAMANKARQGLKTLAAGDSMGRGYNRLAREFTDAGTVALTTYNPYLGAAAYLNRGKLTKFFAKNPDAMSAVALSMGGGYVASVPFMAFESRRGYHEGGYTGSVTRPANHLLRNVRVGVGLLTGGVVDIDLGIKYNRRDGYSGRVGLHAAGMGATYRSSSKDGSSYDAGLSFPVPVPGASANLGYSYSRHAGAGVNAGLSFGVSENASANIGISYSRKGGLGFSGGTSVAGNAFGNPGKNLGLNFNVSENGAWGAGVNVSAANPMGRGTGIRSAGMGLNFSGGPGGKGFGASALLNGADTVSFSQRGGWSVNQAGLGSALMAGAAAIKQDTMARAERAFLNGAGITERTAEKLEKLRNDPKTAGLFDPQTGELTEDGFDKLGGPLLQLEHDALVASGTNLNNRSRDTSGVFGQLGLIKDQLLGALNGELIDAHGYVDSNGTFHQSTCFTAGTLIAVPGGFRAIETLRIGDPVLSFDESGKIETSRVSRLFVRQTDALFRVRYADGTEIETTGNHPFYVENHGWVEAHKLGRGMVSLSGANTAQLSLHPQGAATVSRTAPANAEIVSVRQLESSATVYNFEVPGNHTYFVSERSIAVHNQCGKYGQCDVPGIPFKDSAIAQAAKFLKETGKELAADRPELTPEQQTAFNAAQDDAAKTGNLWDALGDVASAAWDGATGFVSNWILDPIAGVPERIGNLIKHGVGAREADLNAAIEARDKELRAEAIVRHIEHVRETNEALADRLGVSAEQLNPEALIQLLEYEQQQEQTRGAAMVAERLAGNAPLLDTLGMGPGGFFERLGNTLQFEGWFPTNLDVIGQDIAKLRKIQAGEETGGLFQRMGNLITHLPDLELRWQTDKEIADELMGEREQGKTRIASYLQNGTNLFHALQAKFPDNKVNVATLLGSIEYNDASSALQRTGTQFSAALGNNVDPRVALARDLQKVAAMDQAIRVGSEVLDPTKGMVLSATGHNVYSVWERILPNTFFGLFPLPFQGWTRDREASLGFALNCSNPPCNDTVVLMHGIRTQMTYSGSTDLLAGQVAGRSTMGVNAIAGDYYGRLDIEQLRAQGKNVVFVNSNGNTSNAESQAMVMTQLNEFLENYDGGSFRDSMNLNLVTHSRAGHDYAGIANDVFNMSTRAVRRLSDANFSTGEIEKVRAANARLYDRVVHWEGTSPAFDGMDEQGHTPAEPVMNMAESHDDLDREGQKVWEEIYKEARDNLRKTGRLRDPDTLKQHVVVATAYQPGMCSGYCSPGAKKYPLQERLESSFTDKGAGMAYSRTESVLLGTDPRTGANRYAFRDVVTKESDGAVSRSGQMRGREFLSNPNVEHHEMALDHAESTDDPRMMTQLLDRIGVKNYSVPAWMYVNPEKWTAPPPVSVSGRQGFEGMKAFERYVRFLRPSPPGGASGAGSNDQGTGSP